jgi:Tol biopolymer transport system component
VETGRERQLDAKLPHFRWLRWSPDGRFILVGGLEEKNLRNVVYKVDVLTGERTVILRTETGMIPGAALSPDGKALVYSHWYGTARSAWFMVRDLETGHDKQLVRAAICPHPYLGWALSPDGKQLAFILEFPAVRTLNTISTTGGQPKELLRMKEKQASDVAWTSDSQNVLFMRGNALWRIPAEGGEPRKLWTWEKRHLSFEGISVHPDGRNLAFDVREVRSEVWVMENFLPEAPVAKLEPELAVRRIWADAPDSFFTGAPSRDGKYLSYVDWETGDLAVRELATGKNRRLTSEGWSKGRAGHSIFSPDSKYIACRWRGRDAGGLRIIGLDGSERCFIKHPEGITILRPTNWSSDGKQILAFGGAMWDDSKDAFKFLKILFVSVEDGDVRVLKTIEPLAHRKRSEQFRMSLSPDGRYVAYSFPQADNSGRGDIWVFETDGGPEIQVVEHPADDFVLAWSPDGSRIVFASDRTGTMGIWAIDVSDGKPEGVPRLLKPEIGRFHGLGLTQNGAYYYGVFSGGSNVYVATYDPQKGNITGKPVLAIQHYEGSNWAPDWSPDGRYLACLSSGPGMTPRLVIQSMETGEVREITPELKELNVHSLRWSADGRSLLGAGSPTSLPWGALQIDVKTGEVTTIVQGPAISPESAPDGKAIFYLRNVGDGGRMVRYESATGEEKELYNAPGFISRLALSPEGGELAFFESGALKVLPVIGGEPRELAKVENIATIAWTRDGRYLLYGAASGDKTTELWRIAAKDGEPRKLDLAMRGLGHLRFHPDGRRITFMGEMQKEKSEVWVMENFLPVDFASAAGK